ncbi:Zinc finger transcription factor [Pleurostoma richardsiae]|uniref:Zinc finger transcription factor n=1 Tax=Pleurostoma richardsiae TaxID=41990 RepID=A0AA38VKK1_9PEZI|nr:Zinc finger transcription factor [Pleurostoma richardsiae]
MASYGYGPPPPAPPPAPPTNGPQAYGQQYSPPFPQQAARGGHPPRGGGRAGHHPGDARAGYPPGPPVSYGYNGQQPQPYAPQNPVQYPLVQHSQPGNYPAQQWPEQGHHQAQQPAPAPLAPQNYHPNFAGHLYQQPSYSQQPSYAAPPQQPYGQPYPVPQGPNGPPQQWVGPHPHPPHHPQSQPSFTGRGRGGHHGDRGPSKAQVMGPPIRMGFDNGAHDHPAPVSNSYPQPFGAPQGTGPYPPAPYQGYPPPQAPAPMPGPPQYDGHFNHNNRHHSRGGFHTANNSFRSRPQFGGDKIRHNKKSGGPPSTPNTQYQKPDAASAGKKKKRKTNTLGLTPGDDSDDDDADEEAKLTEMIGADAPQVQDIAAWVAERRRNFPTQSHVKAKMAAVAAQTGDKVREEDLREAQNSALAKQQQKADKLRRQLEKVESSIKRKREQQDEGDEMRDVTASSSTSSSSKSDDEKPEAMSVKQEQQPYLPPPAKKADPTKHCKYYSTGGTCGKKGKCRFVHDPAVREAALKEREMNGGRMTLQQRLILNDKDQEDLTIVKTLQYLKEKGLMRDDTHTPRAAPNNGQPSSDLTTQLSAVPKSHLPPPPINGLPAQPPMSAVSNTPTVRYQGWNLSGFGNTGVKPGDD